jgi:hypothetical protein
MKDVLLRAGKAESTWMISGRRGQRMRPAPTRAVSASLGAAIQYVKAATIMIAFAVAVVILLEGPVGDNAPSGSCEEIERGTP